MAPHSSTPVWKTHGRRSLVGYSPWGRKESDTTERLHFHFLYQLSHQSLELAIKNHLFLLKYNCFGASLVAQLVKNLPTMRETWVQSLDWEDPLEKGKATHSSILAWRIPWTV